MLIEQINDDCVLVITSKNVCYREMAKYGNIIIKKGLVLQ